LTHLHSAQRAAARLSRLQQNLLLLVKIENDQFQQRELVDIKRLVESRLELLEDFIVTKKLHISTECLPLQRQLNLFLAETLVGNLLGNAVKHNLPEDGWIIVQLTEKALIISNSGFIPEVPAQKLTERFQRSSSQAEGLGLGLAIAKEICEVYDWTLQITFEQGTWKTSVQFR
jgi:two-component system sensor histidine kinase QseC